MAIKHSLNYGSTEIKARLEYVANGTRSATALTTRFRLQFIFHPSNIRLLSGCGSMGNGLCSMVRSSG